MRAGRIQEARSELEAAIALDPKRASLATRLARIQVEAGELGRAIGVLEREPPTLAEDPEYHAFLAALYQRSGDNDRAARLYAAVLRHRPGHAHWWMGLGISLENQGRDREARRVYETALAAGGLGTAPRRFVGGRLDDLAGRP